VRNHNPMLPCLRLWARQTAHSSARAAVGELDDSAAEPSSRHADGTDQDHESKKARAPLPQLGGERPRKTLAPGQLPSSVAASPAASSTCRNW